MICSLLGFGLSTGYAQESVNSGGGDGSGPGGSVAYSIGQLAYTTVSNPTSGSVAQGVQQAFEISTVGIDNPDWNFSLEAYPNPTSDYLNLEVLDLNTVSLSYQLFDMQGKVLKGNQIQGSQTRIGVQEFPQGSYFLRISDGNKLVHTFKILKN